MIPRVAVVTPRPERRERAERWTRLLGDRAEYRLCASPEEATAGSADLLLVDAECDDLDTWIRQVVERGRPPESIVVFGEGRTSDRPPVNWGQEGTDVLATISDFLERRELLDEADEYLRDLEESNERLEKHRRRFESLVLEQAETVRGVNASLAREVDELTHLQAIARHFAVPGPPENFADRLAGLLAAAFSAEGAALCRLGNEGWTVDGSSRISVRNALVITPVPEAAATVQARPSTRKDRTGVWVPFDEGPAPRLGLALLVRTGAPAPAEDGAFLASVRSIVREGLETRRATNALVQRKGQSERILQTLRGGLLKLNASGRIALANPAFAEMARCSQDALLGVDIRELLPSQVCDRLLAVPEDTGFLDDVETSLRTRSGSHVPVTLRASALPDGAGGNELLVLLADLSRRKEVEAEVRKVDRLAALGRLSAGVAHEIRNPLAGIRTTAEILRGRLEGEEHRRFVDVILEETERLDRIVGSLLQFAKPPEPRTSALDVPALLQRTQQLAAGRAADRRITVRVRTEPGLPLPLADRDQILQVVLNLVLNAVDATPDGGEVRLDAVRDGDSVVVRVEDDGPGIAPSARERIFDPFFTTKPGGTGLGLSISRNILASHGGSLRIDGTGPGTRALASLPLTGRGRKGH